MNFQRRLYILTAVVSCALVFSNGPTMAFFHIFKTNLNAKIASVLPNKREDAWLKIDWHTNLMKARDIAQKANRPLFLWVMNGHPLGCT